MRSSALRAASGAALTLLLVAACSSSDGVDGRSPQPSSSQPGRDAAAALVTQYRKPQPALHVPALPSKPPGGKTMAILTCGFPACQTLVAGAAKGAAALGWHVRTYTTQISPEVYVATWNQMLQTPPDLIVFTGLLPNTVIKHQLAQVARLRIPTVAIGSSDPPGPVVRAVLGGPRQAALSGRLMGAEVVDDAGSRRARALFVWDPAQTDILGPARTTFRSMVTQVGGSVADLAVASADTGRTIPGQVVSYLQAHPDTKYVAFAVSDLGTGVPAAIRTAGLTGVKTVSRWPQASDLAAIEHGSQWAQVTEEGAASGYRAVDTLARILEHQPFDTAPTGWHQIMTKSDVHDPTADLVAPGVPQVFLHAWHLG